MGSFILTLLLCIFSLSFFCLLGYDGCVALIRMISLHFFVPLFYGHRSLLEVLEMLKLFIIFRSTSPSLYATIVYLSPVI